MRLIARLRVGQETVGVEIQQGALSWTASHPVVAESLRDTVSLALREIPRSRWLPRPAVVATVDGHAARVKRLRGLPNMPSGRVLDSIVRENASRFFLWNVPFVTTSVYRLGHDEAVAAVIDAAVVDAIVAGCADAGFTVRSIAPAEDTRLVFKPVRTNDAEAPVPRQRAVWAIAATSIAAIIALLTPGLTAKHKVRAAERELATLDRTERRVEDATRDEQQSALLLSDVARFEHGRRSATLLLAALTDALPPESALTTVRSDSAGVDLVVVSARAAGVLGALDRVPGVIAPEIIGPISKELAGTREVERATIHFKYDPSAVKMPRVPYVVDRKVEDGGEE